LSSTVETPGMRLSSSKTITPCGGCRQKIRESSRLLMELVRATGLSALIATHNLELAARMDRIVRLSAGAVS